MTKKLYRMGLQAMAMMFVVQQNLKYLQTSIIILLTLKILMSKAFVEVNSNECIIPPNSFALASTVEYFKIPRSTLVICLGKSTYARCGIIVNVTPLEPEWEGHVTLEFSNTTPLTSKNLCQ